MAEVKQGAGDAIRLVRELGFPAVVAFFVLWRLEGSMQALNVEITRLREAILIRNAAHSVEK